MAKMMGFHKSTDVVGITNYDLRCDAANNAEVFREQDRKSMIIKNNVRTLEVNWVPLLARYGKGKNQMENEDTKVNANSKLYWSYL